MYVPGPPPLDPSWALAYISEELGKISKEFGAYETIEYTPVWTGATTNPVLGNGSLRGFFRIQHDFCESWVRLLAGSTTTFGTGAWRISLPKPAAKVAQIGEVLLLDASATTRYVGVARIEANTNVLEFASHAATAPVANTVPFTWAVNDELLAHIRYFL